MKSIKCFVYGCLLLLPNFPVLELCPSFSMQTADDWYQINTASPLLVKQTKIHTAVE
jgi:hypothetical protein